MKIFEMDEIKNVAAKIKIVGVVPIKRTILNRYLSCDPL